jgi:hypothetical protein
MHVEMVDEKEGKSRSSYFSLLTRNKELEGGRVMPCPMIKLRH